MKHLSVRIRILRVVLLPVVAPLIATISLGMLAARAYDWLFDYVHRDAK